MSASPLDPFVDGTAKRARFRVRPALDTLPDLGPGLLAGAAEADITPPPGMPKAGYSANAHDGDGFRTRLRARVLHLRSGTASIALVQCDLLGGSAVVQHVVADAVKDTTDVRLPGLFVGATHTHAGPGQFLGTDFYNRFASNRSGFDPAYTQFLVAQIAGAVERAVAARAPAALAVGAREVWGLTRNRSLPPHVENPSVTDKRTEPQRPYVSVNPWLRMIRVDTAAGTPLAAMVVFSVHGTGISMRAHDYNADVWAYLVGELRTGIRDEHGVDAVVGAVEGTHADVGPAICPGAAGHVEARRIGRGIGREALELHRSLGDHLDARPVLGASLREVDLDRSSVIAGVALPKRAAVGAALVAGAHENETPVIAKLPPFKAGTPKRWGTGNAQAEKWVLGSRWLQPLIVPSKSFPRILPLQAIRIGEAMLVGFPFEVTVDSGRRFAAAVAAATDIAEGAVIVSSVANEYSGYVTTPEEYRLQHYEGGHTIYGPDTQPFLSAHGAENAAKATPGAMAAEVGAERSFDLAVHRYLPAPGNPTVARRWMGPAAYHDLTITTDPRWEQRWEDVAAGDLHWHEPLVRVERSIDGGPWETVADDGGWDVQVTRVAHHEYAARWHLPALRPGWRHRFVLAANNGRPETPGDPFD